MSSVITGNSVPYASIAVSMGGEIIFENYFWAGGVAPLATAPVARTASIGKAITGAAIGTLYQAGTLLPTDKLVSILPEYFYRSDGTRLFIDSRMEWITVDHLANMQGGWNRGIDQVSGDNYDDSSFGMDFEIAVGLSNMFPEKYPNGIKLPLKTEHLIEWENQRPLDFDPGTGSAGAWDGEYSNYGFVLLGKIVEKITGKRFDTYVEETLFKPLGIEMSFMASGGMEATGPNAHGNLWPFANWGQTLSPWEGYCDTSGCYGLVETSTPYYDAIARFGPGDILTTATDYVKFLTVFENTPKSEAILSMETKSFMFSRKPYHGSSNPYYAYGQVADDYNMRWNHGGYVPGTANHFMRYTFTPFCGEAVAIVVLLNSTPSSSIQPVDVLQSIESVLLDLAPDLVTRESMWDGSTNFALNKDCTPLAKPTTKCGDCTVGDAVLAAFAGGLYGMKPGIIARCNDDPVSGVLIVTVNWDPMDDGAGGLTIPTPELFPVSEVINIETGASCSSASPPLPPSPPPYQGCLEWSRDGLTNTPATCATSVDYWDAYYSTYGTDLPCDMLANAGCVCVCEEWGNNQCVCISTGLACNGGLGCLSMY